MRGRQPAPELLLAVRVEPSGLDPLERQVALLHVQHARRAQGAGLAQPAQAGRLGLVLARWRVGACLDERLPAVRQHDAKGFVDVAPADAPHIARAGRQAHAGSLARNCSSRPLQAACTRSSTSSKPPAAP